MLISQALLHGVADEFGGSSQRKLFKNASAMGADGLRTDAKTFGDVFAGFSQRDKLENFEFAVGELLMRHFARAGAQVFD